MTDRMDTESEKKIKSGQDVEGSSNLVLRFTLALCGALAGAAYYYLVDQQALKAIDPRFEQWVTLFALGFFPVLGFSLGPLPVGRAFLAALVTGGVASAMGFWAGFRFDQSGIQQGLLNHGDLFVVPYLALIALCIPLAIAFGRDCKRWNDHAILYDIVVRSALKFLLAVFFVGLFWALFFLSNLLLEIVGFSIWDLIGKTGLIFAILSYTCAGLAFAVAEEMPGVIDLMLRLLVRLLMLFVPIVSLVVLFFLQSVLFQGLDNVFSQLSAASVMLAVAGGALLLVAFVLGRDDKTEKISILTEWTSRLLLLALPLIAGIAIYALWLRVGEYGWTPSRLQAVCLAGFVTVWAFGAAGSVLFGGVFWRQKVRSVNVAALVLMVSLIATWFSPVLNAQRIATNSQVDRLLDGRADLSKFKFGPLQRDWGRAGTEGIVRVRAAEGDPQSNMVIAALEEYDKTEALRAEDPNEHWRQVTRKGTESNLKRLLVLMPSQPAGRELPGIDRLDVEKFDFGRVQSIRLACEKAAVSSIGEGCHAVFGDFLSNRAGDEIVLLGYQKVSGLNTFLMVLEDTGLWTPFAMDVATKGDEARQIVDNIRANRFSIDAPSTRDLVIGGVRISPGDEAIRVHSGK